MLCFLNYVKEIAEFSQSAGPNCWLDRSNESLVAFDTDLTLAIQITMINDSITAYSTAVGPSSS